MLANNQTLGGKSWMADGLTELFLQQNHLIKRDYAGF